MNDPRDFFMIDGALLPLAELDEYREKWAKSIGAGNTQTAILARQSASEILRKNMVAIRPDCGQDVWDALRDDIAAAVVAAAGGRSDDRSGGIWRWLKAQANAEKNPERKATFIEAANAARAIIDGRS